MFFRGNTHNSDSCFTHLGYLGKWDTHIEPTTNPTCVTSPKVTRQSRWKSVSPSEAFSEKSIKFCQNRFVRLENKQSPLSREVVERKPLNKTRIWNRPRGYIIKLLTAVTRALACSAYRKFLPCSKYHFVLWCHLCKCPLRLEKLSLEHPLYLRDLT